MNGNPTPSVITGNAANAFPNKTVKSTMPPQYATTATNGNCTGNAVATSPAMTPPTPAFAMMPPRAANIAGKISDQLSNCSSLPPSRAAASGRSPVVLSAVAKPMIQPSPSALCATCFGLTSETSPNFTQSNPAPPTIATTGTHSTGHRSRLPSTSARFVNTAESPRANCGAPTRLVATKLVSPSTA